jgi:hypothetical protein
VGGEREEKNDRGKKWKKYIKHTITFSMLRSDTVLSLILYYKNQLKGYF